MAYRILLSALGPFGYHWVLELIGTWLGLGLGVLGLDKKQEILKLVKTKIHYQKHYKAKKTQSEQ